MHIDSVDFFYASMPEVTLDADGSQDALLVRVTADGHEGWGECEASPLVSIAAFVTPRSHGVCQPVSASVLGERLDSPADVRRISALVARNSMDLLQAPHVLSGIEMALWDLLGRVLEQPVWKLLGFDNALPKTPYASVLFADTPQETWERARSHADRGFSAMKFGWGPFGLGTLEADIEQIVAARDGAGVDAKVMVDAGQIWEGDFEAAVLRLPALQQAGIEWLEEPFGADSYEEYAALAKLSGTVAIAGGEASHNSGMAKNLIRFGGVRYIQIDSGRIGGLAPSKDVADFATDRGIAYVNHTFTSHLALSGSLQPFAGHSASSLCEYPTQLRALGAAVVSTPIELDANGQVSAPDAPGLGVTVDLDAVRPYLRTVRIDVDGETLYADGARD